MDRIIMTQTGPTLKTQNHSTLSPGSSWDSAITIASSPSSVSSCDGIDDDEWNSFSDSGELPPKSTDEKLDIDSGFSTSSTMQPVAAGKEEPESTPVPTPLDADRLHALFFEYEKLVNGQEVPREREDSPNENNESFSDQPERRQKAISYPTANVTHKQQRGISKSKTQQRKKVTSGRASRTKHALASSVQEYEYMHLGEARRASNGSIEVEVFWAPIFLPCDQLRGEQAIEEAKDLVIRKFGHVTWDTEQARFGCVGTNRRTLG